MSKSKKQLLGAAVIFTVLLVKWFSNDVNAYLLNDRAAPNFYFSVSAQVLYYLLPAVTILFLFYPSKEIPKELGINREFLNGLVFAFLFTLPMLVGYFLMGRYNTQHTLIQNIVFSFKDGFREELFYRAFLFGQLFRRVNLGFIPAVAVNGLIFGLSHLYQAKDLGESLAIFAITFAGAVWFAWLFIEWRNNLWLPVFMHVLMNLYWDLFSTENTAMGGLMLNLPRILTIFLSVYFTIRLNKRQNGKLIISRNNLWK